MNATGAAVGTKMPVGIAAAVDTVTLVRADMPAAISSMPTPSPGGAPLFIVGIVTYNSAADLPACAAGLAVQVAGGQAGSERERLRTHVRVIVADNASADGSADAARAAFPDAVVLETGANLGFGRAHNVIVNEARARGWLEPGAFYLPLNPDVRLEPGYLTALADALTAAGAGFGWAVGKLLQVNSEGRPTGRFYSAGQGVRRDGFPINIGEGQQDAGQFDAPREIMLCSGAAPLLSAALIEAVSDRVGTDRDLFDRAMFMYGEDIELGWRARRAGWRCLYVPAAVAYHRGGSPAGAMRAGAYVNQALAVVKNAWPRDLLFYNAPRLLVGTVARMVTRPRTASVIARGLLGGLPGAWGKRRPPAISRAAMLAWFAWSEAQPTAGAVGWRERARAYFNREARSRR